MISTRCLSHSNCFARSDPAANAVLEQAPRQVAIEFTEPVEPRLSRIEVLHGDGSVADNNDTTRDPGNPARLSVTLKDSRPGMYIVSWRALSEVDGHVTSGSYVFSVGQPIDPAKLGVQGSGALTSPLDMIARALTFVGQAVIAGAVAFRWLVWRPALKSAQLDASVDDRSLPPTKRVLTIALALAAQGRC